MATIILKTPDEVKNYLNTPEDGENFMESFDVAVNELTEYGMFRTTLDGVEITFYVEPFNQ